MDVQGFMSQNFNKISSKQGNQHLVQPGQSRSSFQQLQPSQFLAPHANPVSFADTPQGKNYANTFSQADEQTKNTLITHLQAGAKAGNQHSIDQLNAIQKNGGLKNNPVQVAPENIAGVNLPSPVQKVSDLGASVVKAIPQYGAQVAEGVLGNSSAGETPRAIQDIKQGKPVPASEAGHSQSPVQVAEGALASRFALGAPGEKALGDFVESKIPGVAGKIASTATEGAHQLGSFNAAETASNNASPLNIGKSYVQGAEQGAVLGGAARAVTEAAPPVSKGISKVTEPVTTARAPINNASKVNLANSATRELEENTSPSEHVAFQDSPQGKQYADLFSKSDPATQQSHVANLSVAARQGDPAALDQLNAIKDQVNPAPEFKDTPQGKSYADTFNSADPQTKQQVVQDLSVKARQGDLHSQSQLDAVKDSIAPPVEGTSPLQPAQVEGDTRTSTLGSSVEQKAVEQKLTDSLGDTPQYSQVNMKDQAKFATDLLAQDPEKAERIATGNDIPPAHILPESVFTAVEDKALQDGNVDLLRKLATSTRVGEATAMGQRIRALAERNPESSVNAIKSVLDARTVNTEKRLGKSVPKSVAKTANDIKKTVPKVTRQDWNAFIESIQC